MATKYCKQTCGVIPWNHGLTANTLSRSFLPAGECTRNRWFIPMFAELPNIAVRVLEPAHEPLHTLKDLFSHCSGTHSLVYDFIWIGRRQIEIVSTLRRLHPGPHTHTLENSNGRWKYKLVLIQDMSGPQKKNYVKTNKITVKTCNSTYQVKPKDKSNYKRMPALLRLQFNIVCKNY